MVVHLLKLKGKMVECGISQERMAEHLGINRSTLCRKMSGGGLGFTIGDVNKIIDILELTRDEVMSIFFISKVA